MIRIIRLQAYIEFEESKLRRNKEFKDLFQKEVEQYYEELKSEDLVYRNLIIEWIGEQIPICLDYIKHYNKREKEIKEEIKKLNIELTSAILLASSDCNRQL